MTKEKGFYFDPKKWLGDAQVIAMDWDCRGMHLHLMALAWQQPTQGYLRDDDVLIRKFLGALDERDWAERIKPQIFSAWKKTTLAQESGIPISYWYQPGLLKEAQQGKKPTRKRATKQQEDNSEIDPLYAQTARPGFILNSLLKEKTTATILYEKASVEDNTTIWTLGVQLLSGQHSTQAQSRGFLARLIKQYGEKTVAAAIAEVSVKNSKPADMPSYLTGVLKRKLTEQETGKMPYSTGRGSVAI